MSVSPLCVELTTHPRGKSLAALGGNHGGLPGVVFREPSGERAAIPSHMSISAAHPQGLHTQQHPTRMKLTVHGTCTPQGYTLHPPRCTYAASFVRHL